MMRDFGRAVWAGCMLMVAMEAVAAEKGAFGLDAEIGARRLIGVSWQPAARLALRPGLFFQNVASENTPTLLDPNMPAPVYETEDTAFGGRLEIDYLLRERRRV